MNHEALMENEILARKGRKLVFHLAHIMIRRYPLADIELNDFVGWGYEGLFEAADRWSPDISSFTTYAFFWVRHCMQAGINKWMGIRRSSRNGEGRSSPYRNHNPINISFDEQVHLVKTPDWTDNPNVLRELKCNVHNLPMHLFTPLVYHYYHGFNSQEMAIMFSLSPKEVGEILETAIKKLKEQYGVKDCVQDDDETS